MGPLSCVLVDHFCIVLTALYKISIFVQWLKKGWMPHVSVPGGL